MMAARDLREGTERRVIIGSRRALDALPADTSREDMIASVFGIRGWTVQAEIADTSHRWPMFGWWLTHPTDGLLLFADRGRDGDLGPGYRRRGGPWGGMRILRWAEDVAGLLQEVAAVPRSHRSYPHMRVIAKLAAHAFTGAPADQQAAARLLVALTHTRLEWLLDGAAADPIRVLPGAGTATCPTDAPHWGCRALAMSSGPTRKRP